MAFSSWFARSRLSSKTAFAFLRPSRQLHSTHKVAGDSTAISPAMGYRRLPNWWSSSLLPLAIAVSATSFAFQNHSHPSISESSSALDSGDITIGGKDSTEHEVKGEYKEVPKEFIAELKTILEDNLTTDHEERYFHGKPQNSFHKAVNIPDVVVFPRSEEEVSKILKSCNEYKVPIVPYGGATSIEGHTLAPKGGVCIDMSLMKRVKALHVEDMDVVVEPGIGWMELNEHLEQFGLFFPLDPGPGATIGGMCATRCSGSLAVRYGTMRDNVISLKVVLPNGDVVKTASRARKSAAGWQCAIFLRSRMLQTWPLPLCFLEYRCQEWSSLTRFKLGPLIWPTGKT
uniref:D-lactate dehydrogenase [cytochrome], mitochondrial n=1 Tax=Noccaea caerulescens TaxID=107243 RepID=A0A1J3G4C7_NOCCA